MRRIVLIFMAMALGVLLHGLSWGQDVDLNFDSLPSAQGWTYYLSPYSVPIPESDLYSLVQVTDNATTVNALRLNGIGTTGDGTYRKFMFIDGAYAYTISCRLRVLQHTAQGYFYIGAFAGLNSCIAGINTNSIIFGNSSYSFDASQFHDYRLEARPGVGCSIYIDDVLVFTRPYIQEPDVPSHLLIGQATTYGTVLAEMTQFAFGYDLAIAGGSSLSFKLGEDVSYQFQALGNPPFSWSIVEGTLPSDMNFSSDGILSGTPTEADTFTFTVRVTDGDNNAVERVITLEVLATLPPPVLSVHKSGMTAVPGRNNDYFIVVQNTGSTIAKNVVVVEFVDRTDFTVLSAEPAAIIGAPNITEADALWWVIPELPPGKTEIITYKVKINPSVPIGKEIIGGPVSVGVDWNKFYNCYIIECDLQCAMAEVACGTSLINTIISVFAGSPGGLLGAAAAAIIEITWKAAEWLHCSAEAWECLDCVKKCIQESSADTCTAPQITDGPCDPNEKQVVPSGFIKSDQLLVYPIHFENIGNVEALDVFVTDVLDPNLDLSTLEIITPGASLDAATRTLKWNLVGRNLQPGEGDNVLFSIKSKQGLSSGTEIKNTATIQFEIFQPLQTNEVTNIIDTTPPIGMMDPLPAETTSPFLISWNGSDAIGEIESYSVLVSVNGGAFTPLLERTTDTSLTFTGEAGKSYEFICIATDTAGNVEIQAPIAETVTEVINRPGDLDGDGDVDRDDMNIILAARNTPADGPDDPRDLDHDGKITVLDTRILVTLCTRPGCACQ